MKSKHFYFIAFISFVLQLPVFSAFAQTDPVVAYLDIEVHGEHIKGTSTFAQAKDQIEITGFSLNITGPKDIGSNIASAKSSITIVLQKHPDISSEFLQNASLNINLLNKVTINFFHHDRNGQMVKFQTIELPITFITQFSQHMVTNSPNGSGFFEELQLTTGSIKLMTDDTTTAIGTGAGTPKYDIKTNKSN